MNYIRAFLFTFLTAVGLTASDSKDTSATFFNYPIRYNKVVINILGKDIYESLIVSAQKETYSDTLTRFIFSDSAVEIKIDYSGYNRLQILKLQFFNNNVLIDSSKAPDIHIISHSYKPELKALLMLISLTRTGWITILKGDKSCSGTSASLVVNTKKSRIALDNKNLNLLLNRYDMNFVEIKPQETYMTGSLLIEFTDPYGPPGIVKSIDMQASISLDSTKKRAVIMAKFLPRNAMLTIVTNVQYAYIFIKNLKTEEILVVPQTKGTDSVQLDCRNTYELIFRKHGYNTMRKVCAIKDNDTTLTFSWEPFDRKQILFRSLALPGLGQYYSQRRGVWWWSAATAVSACFAVGAAVSMNRVKSDYEEYNEKYLNESNEFARRKYDTKRRDALSLRNRSNIVYICSLSSLCFLWGANICDALVFAIGPKTKVSINPLQMKRNMTIDF